MHTPSPAATRPSWVWVSAARWPTIGSMPFERSVNISHSWQNSPSPHVIHSSSANSARSTSSRPASRWPTGMATSAGSSRSGALTRPSGSGIGLLYQSSTTARSRSPRTTPLMPRSGSSSHERMRSAGCWVRRAASAPGKSPRAAVGNADSLSSPATCPRWASRSAWASSTWGEDAGRVLGEQPARVREPHAPPVLGEQLLTRLALQLGHLLGDGRGGDVHPTAAPLTDPCRARASRVRRRSRFNM